MATATARSTLTSRPSSPHQARESGEARSSAVRAPQAPRPGPTYTLGSCTTDAGSTRRPTSRNNCSGEHPALVAPRSRRPPTRPLLLHGGRVGRPELPRLRAGAGVRAAGPGGPGDPAAGAADHPGRLLQLARQLRPPLRGFREGAGRSTEPPHTPE